MSLRPARARHAIVLAAAGAVLSGILPVKPDCSLQVVPLALESILLPVDGTGSVFLPVTLGAGTPPFTPYLQFLVADPGAAYGLASTQALRLEVP